MHVCFTGLNPGAMTSYPLGVARALAQKEPSARFKFVLDTEGVLDGRELPAASSIESTGSPTAARAFDIVSGSDLVVTTAQRLPDSAIVAAARKKGIPTAMFQHGLYLDFMKREGFFLLRRARKSVRYLRFAKAIADIHGRGILRYMYEFASVFLWDASYREARIDTEGVNVDRVLLNGEAWRAFHSRKYGYRSDQQVVVGYPDYEQLDAIEREPQTEAVCYVAQTLVEHGRLDAGRLSEFLDILVSAVDGRRLIIKLHPASDADLYSAVTALPNVVLTKARLPHVTHYVGHYSTYLSLVPFLSRYLFLWELEGHRIPDFLSQACWAVGRSPKDLKSALAEPVENACPDLTRVEALEHYFWRNPKCSPYEKAADELLSLIRAPVGEARRSGILQRDDHTPRSP